MMDEKCEDDRERVEQMVDGGNWTGCTCCNKNYNLWT